MVTFKSKIPTLGEYKRLRDSIGWNLKERGISDERAKRSLENSPLCICAFDNKKLVGMVRLSGDLEMYGYIQDTIILPEYQRKGIGTQLLQKVFSYIGPKKGYLLGVCPSKVSTNFYEKFGFKKRPEKPNGFMSLEIK